MAMEELIMELKMEQGLPRITQVQPPAAVWERFFGVRVLKGLLPTYRLQNKVDNGNPEQSKVVRHHHNLTIEIGGAQPPRPAILRMLKTGTNSFDYWVYRPGSSAFRSCAWLLKNVAQDNSSGRNWVVVSR